MGDAWTRRTFLGALGAGVAASAAGCRARPGMGESLATAARVLGETAGGASTAVPVAFVGHGSPMLAVDAAKGSELSRWTASFPRPRAVLVVSAHWERAPATIGATTPRPLVYDFSGFPDALYRIRYDAPGAPDLADRVEGLLRPLGDVRRAPARGLDHGAWVPLRWMYPDADVPVLPLSLPTQDPVRLLALGRALAPLSREGVLVLGSGNVVHNLGRLARDGAATPRWASDFDAWVEDVVSRRDLDALADYARRAPAPDLAHPTKEHFTPLILTVGAGVDAGGAVRYPVAGFEAGSISRRCVQIG
jgi:4,5-DOPA dioxygenase extradiol